VTDTAGRLLRLLPLLTARPNWRGDELAARLGVTTRTVRRDIDRLRELGYPVHAIPGRRGGYALGPGGARLPPLLLDEDSAVAVALGLRAAAADPALRGSQEAAARAAAAIDQVLPPRLRRRVEALPSEQVEERAVELARRAARDPQLARKATASLCTELGPPRLPWAAALEVERGAQLWSLRRRAPQ
jgi:predicted DNA-binding transcriptional regulator YafY